MSERELDFHLTAVLSDLTTASDDAVQDAILKTLHDALVGAAPGLAEKGIDLIDAIAERAQS